MRPSPGLAFSFPSDAGFVVGLVTLDVPKIGSLIWIASPMFDDEPTLDAVQRIDRWRWCVFFPLAAALRRRAVDRIGVIPIPSSLENTPLRSGDKRNGWRRVDFVDGVAVSRGPETDPSVSIYQVVNDTRLKEMIVSGWQPSEKW